MSPEEVEKLRKVFKTIDINGDNVLTYDEIKKGYCINMGKVMSDEELTELFK